MAKVDAKVFDHPVLLIFFLTLGVIATTAILSGIAAHFGWTGLLGLLKGGVAPNATNDATY